MGGDARFLPVPADHSEVVKMKDVITCPECGGNLIREDELQDLYLCDCCGFRLVDGQPDLSEMEDDE